RLAALRAGAWECITPPHDADEILLKIGAYVHAKLDADRARTEGLLDAVTGLYNRQGLARRARELGSQAFREHGPLACVVLALDIEPAEPASAQQQGGTSLGRYVQAIKSAARLSDVIGRLSATEFAVLAPGTDAGGARRLAERLASSVSATTVAPPAGTSFKIAPSSRTGSRCSTSSLAAATSRWLYPVRSTSTMVPVRVPRINGSTPAPSGGLSIKITS